MGAVQEEELLPIQNSMTDCLMGVVTRPSISRKRVSMASAWMRESFKRKVLRANSVGVSRK